MRYASYPKNQSREIPIQSFKRVLAIIIGLAAAIVSASMLKGATLTVTTLTDSGAGSLRQTLAGAASGDTISIPLTGTITLTNGGKLVINKNIQISGPSNGVLQVSAKWASSVITVLTNVTASLTDLSLVNGSSRDSNSVAGGRTVGGGVQNYGKLTMTRCVVSGCDAFEGAGGGIFSMGQLTLRQCSISNNAATIGGGICDYGTGTLVVDGSTINGNRTSGPQGDDGGGIFKTEGGSLQLTNATVSLNTSYEGVAGVAIGSKANFDSCTIASNSSSLYVGGVGAKSSVSSRNTIFANNSSRKLPKGWDISANIVSGGYNLIRDTNACTITGTLTGNIYGADPLLGPLQNNGGPTLSHSLLTGSPAIDRGGAGGLAVDQRGYSRTYDTSGIANVGDGTDIGAVESGSSLPGTPTPPPVTPPPAGGWSPLSLGSKLLVWVEPTNCFKDVAMTTKGTLNDIVRVAKNMGYGGFNFVNSETGRKTAPYLNANRPGGYPTLFFEGNIADGAPIPYPNYENDCGYLTSGLQIGLIQRPFTVYWVGCRWTTGDRMIGSYWGTGYDSYNGQNTENTCYDTGGGLWWNDSGGASIVSYSGGYSKLHLFKAVCTSGSTVITVDGNACINATGGVSPLYGLVLGSRRGPAAGQALVPGESFSHSLGGDLGTFILIQGTVTAAEHTSITNWLNQKYGGLPR